MNRKLVGSMAGIVLIAFLVGGLYFFPELLTIRNQEQKPAVPTQSVIIRMDSETPIVFEKEYKRSHQVIISEFDNKQDVIGYTLEEIQNRYTEANGYNVSFKDGSLIIRQTVDDWSPADKARCRLKEYKDLVAIYTGPDSYNDSLLKVTAIRFSTLPPTIQTAIRQGQYEFQDEAAINDALENLDEYF